MSQNASSTLTVKLLGRVDYQTTWEAMRDFTNERGSDTPDELWLLEHPPVFTQGQAGKAEHILQNSTIPIVQTDRGGQVTYHGPGQLVGYLLLDIKRAKVGVRELVTKLEESVVTLLSKYGINSYPKADAPGVYVDDKKIASLGLRVRKGCTYHGVAINIGMDLAPFTYINPCGYQGLEIVQLNDLVGSDFIGKTGALTPSDIMQEYATILADAIGFNETVFIQNT